MDVEIIKELVSISNDKKIQFYFFYNQKNKIN